MATFGTGIRRGLPRTPGGQPWPPAGDAPAGLVEPAPTDGSAEATGAAVQVAETAGSTPGTPQDVTPEQAGAAVVAVQVAETAGSTPGTPQDVTPEQAAAAVAAGAAGAHAAGGSALRRGLPRVPGGEPWPPAGVAAAVAAVQVAGSAGSTPGTPQDVTLELAAAAVAAVQVAATAGSAPGTPQDVTPEQAAAAVAAVQVAATAGSAPGTPQDVTPEQTAAAATPGTAGAHAAAGIALRRGLPRVAGGEPWPAAGFVQVAAAAVGDVETDAAPLPVADAPPTSGAEAGAVPVAEAAASVPASPVPGTPSGVPLSEPLPFPRTVFPGKTAFTHPAPKPEPTRIGPFTKGQWAGAVIVAGGGLLFAAGMAVVFVRWLLSLEPMQDFIATFPGEYHLPEGAPVGIPPWLGWQHFFNIFLMVLIIRSGLQVRTEKRPTAFWSPRRNDKRKISLNLWFHQSLDILWIVNGIIFIVLLFVTGQWMKIVPTSWEVFPNAISAGLQYVSLDWPTENGWVNYNSLQQLAYFTTVFLAAPLAIVTGVRMSGIWPSNAKTLNRLYPVEWARAVHFPVMLYFVAFIIVHVALVFATGALRNLNHMYASQDAVNWTGFWIFAASMLVIVAGWVAARPLILAPIARLFGRVSGR